MATDTGSGAGHRNGAEGASGAARLAAPPDDARTPRLPFPVVGIGASAGGLEAYTEFLQACPADAGMAYVLVQHLPPDRESLLVEILARQTRMPVAEVTDGQVVEPDSVYVIRPGRTLTVRDGRLRLGPELAARGHGRPVDDFFRSLAEEQQQRAVAVVFSGMGSNGTAGAEAVKAVGGLVIAQEPDSAKFPAMPRSLVDAHLPDFILRPAEVPAALAKYARQPYAADDHAAADASARDEPTLADVLAVLRTRTRHDFSGYRKPTLLRRVRRRMGFGQFAAMGDYVKALRQTPGEVTALADDLLIHVTGFFRDPEAWDALKEKVIGPLADGRADGAEVRCWVTACATGEEAYTLAILLAEAAEARGKRFDVKVFATDMAARALGLARAGVFPNGIESEVTPERLGRFFDQDENSYRVRKELRELVVFAPQNVLQDPPFSRLDVATCRNLLIYLEPDTQRRLLALLHFGLREGGALMLGSSESAAPADGDFEAIDKRHRIFRRVGPTRAGTLDLPALTAIAREARPAPGGPPRPAPPAAAQLVSRALLDRHTPAAVAVDAAGQLVHVHGDTARFLTVPTGGPTLDLLALANDQVRGAVQAALHRAADAQAPVAVRDGLIDTPEGRRRVEVAAAPLGPRGAAPLYLVTFRDYPEPPPPPSAENPSAPGQLADDLWRARNELQGALEEMQSSNEELKASHEETTSLNEELQSTNEELETSKEEMQSLNEELVTVNAQLQAKMGELEATANDLGSLLTSTDIAVLFLDPKFRIRRYTPAVKDLLDLIPSDAGRPLADLRRKFSDPDLLADARRVLDRLVPVERAVESESGKAYLRRVLPYRTQDDRIDGVVVAFVDVTPLKRAEDALRAGEEQFRMAIEDAPIPVLMQAEDGQVLQVSRTWTELTGYALADVPTADAWLARAYGPGADAVRAHTHELFRGDRKTLDVEFAIRTRAGGERHWSFSASTPGARRDGRRFLVGMAVDVTDRKRAEDALRTGEERLRLALAAARMGIWTLELGIGVQTRDASLNALLGLGARETTQPFDEFLTHIHPDDAAAVREAFAASVREGRPLDAEFRVVRPDGAVRWLRDQGDVLEDSAAEPRHMAGACVDVTDLKGAEAALRDARDRLEVRVAERTADLGRAMDALEAEMARRRELALRLGTVQEDERRRVARDLHDTIGQLMTGLSLAFKSIESGGDLPPPVAAKVAEARRVMSDLGREVHRLAVRLRPTSLDDIGLGPALGQLVSEWSSRAGVPADFHAAGVGPGRLPAAVETAVYRVVQEALTNVAKHAGATTVGVVLTRPDGAVSVVVEDNGAGFDPAATPNGRLGLLGMRERVELVGGEIDIESASGAGTTVAVRIPIPEGGAS
ncbi:MAG TPA: chemotaxis protein CheB [Urbifossiella sp.]|jgi:two-component system CheB/CheR fusion protein|nr:chemotaxis protein CheB [Urbifossiella sp.]